ncbi:MAG TPA: AAC(3) family N-acetyltransferase [Anaerolineales bacterium]|nr:AAC(3) family N-acetyltransferase [Anaerolineales bacterium]
MNEQDLIRQILEMGVKPGGILLVHTSFSKVKPVEGGPAGLIKALQSALGPDGTLVMPSMSYDDEHPFDKKVSPCPEMGVVADTFWRLPGVLRGDNNHAFAAAGPLAAQITAPHPIDPPHGLDSPVGRVFELDGQVLLLGVGHDANTTIHLAENLAGIRYRREKYITLLKKGVPIRFEYREIDHCCQNFSLVDRWLDERKLQQRGTVGYAEARLAASGDVVSVATERLKANETIFLHPRGFDEECDDAWASLPSPDRTG